MIAKKLIARPAPDPCESLLSYQIRLARENGYGYHQLAALTKSFASVPLRSLHSQDRFRINRAFSELTGKDLTLFDPWAWARPYKQMMDYRRLKVCSKCYADMDIIKSHWHLRTSLICHKHNCYMIDSCDICFEELTINSFINRECTCGRAIKDIVTTTWPEPELVNSFSNDVLLNSESVGNTLGSLFNSYTSFHPFLLLVDEDALVYCFKNLRTEITKLAKLRATAEQFRRDKDLGSVALIQIIKEYGNIGSFQKPFALFIGKKGFKQFNDLLEYVFVYKSNQLRGMKVTLRFLEKIFSLDQDQLKARIKADSSIRFASSAGGGLIDASDVPRLFKHESAWGVEKV